MWSEQFTEIFNDSAVTESFPLLPNFKMFRFARFRACEELKVFLLQKQIFQTFPVKTLFSLFQTINFFHFEVQSEAGAEQVMNFVSSVLVSILRMDLLEKLLKENSLNFKIRLDNKLRQVGSLKNLILFKEIRNSKSCIAFQSLLYSSSSASFLFELFFICLFFGCVHIY